MENEVYRPLEEKTEPDKEKQDQIENPVPAAGDSTDQNESAVRFLPQNDGSVKYDETNQKKQFVGLTKEELMVQANTPFWVRMRWIFIILFALLWIAMLVGAIVIVITAPKCPEKEDPMWWKNGVLYYVDVRAFKDSDNNGIGDLKGVASSLDYLQSIGARGVWLSPIYPSGGDNMYYDITDHKSIDKEIGTIADFEKLAAELRQRDMKLVIEFIPNHTSKKHPWFVKSQNNSAEYKDYYVWTDTAPDDPWWQTTTGDRAWSQASEPRDGEYYYHAHQSFLPDLNLSSDAVQQELTEILQFWLNKKVDGFHIDSALLLYEVPVGVQVTEDLVPVSQQSSAIHGINKLISDYTRGKLTNATVGRPESINQVKTWQDLVRNYKKNPERLRTILADSLEPFTQQFADAQVESVLSPALVDLDLRDNPCSGTKASACVGNNVDKWLSSVNATKINTYWQSSNAGSRRISSRVEDRKLVNAINMVRLLLPGPAVTYYGEELAMADTTNVNAADGRDTYVINMGGDNYAGQNRDYQRAPMAWNDALNGGFTGANASIIPFLPLSDDYREFNVKTEKERNNTALKVYQQLVQARKNNDLKSADKVKIDQKNGGIFSFTRTNGDKTYLVITSFNDGSTYDAGKWRKPLDPVPAEGDNSAPSVPVLLGLGQHKDKKSVKLGKLNFDAGEGIVLEL